MAILSIDQIRSMAPRTEEVEVPEWGGSVRIRELTVGQQDAVASTSRGNVDMALKVFLEGVVEPKFTAADYDALKEASGAAVQRVVGRILVLSGMTEEAQKEILGKSAATRANG